MRLDYLLATPALAARRTDVQVLRDPDTDHASDHYPLLADFDLPLP